MYMSFVGYSELVTLEKKLAKGTAVLGINSTTSDISHSVRSWRVSHFDREISQVQADI
jgi:hypothetical protein